MPLKQITYGSSDYFNMVRLRTEVLRSPLGLSFSDAELSEEKNDIFIVAIEETKIIACCILTPLHRNTIKLRQMAVKPGMQKKGIGAALLRFAETVAGDKGYTDILLHAREEAIPFYEKHGYEQEGDLFEEVTLPHRRMRKKI